MDHDARVDALAAWRIATTSRANKTPRMPGPAVPVRRRPEDLRWMMASPASLSDLGEMYLLQQPKGAGRSSSRGRQTVNLGDIQPGQLAGLIGAKHHG